MCCNFDNFSTTGNFVSILASRESSPTNWRREQDTLSRIFSGLGVNTLPSKQSTGSLVVACRARQVLSFQRRGNRTAFATPKAQPSSLSTQSSRMADDRVGTRAEILTRHIPGSSLSSALSVPVSWFNAICFHSTVRGCSERSCVKEECSQVTLRTSECKQ